MTSITLKNIIIGQEILSIDIDEQQSNDSSLLLIVNCLFSKVSFFQKSSLTYLNKCVCCIQYLLLHYCDHGNNIMNYHVVVV